MVIKGGLRLEGFTGVDNDGICRWYEDGRFRGAWGGGITQRIRQRVTVTPNTTIN